MAVSERIPYFPLSHRERQADRKTIADTPRRVSDQETTRRSRLEQRQTTEKITNPEVVAEIKQRILAIRRAALEAPEHGVIEGGIVRHGIPFEKENHPSYDSIEKILLEGESSGGAAVAADALSGKVIRIRRPHGGYDEHITFARGVGSKGDKIVVTTIALATEQDDTGNTHIKKLSLTEATGVETATISLDPTGDGVTLVDYSTQEKRKLFHGGHNTELSEDVIDELDEIRRAISEEKVPLSTLDMVQQRAHEAREFLREKHEQYATLLKKLDSLEERISGTRRFMMTHDAYYSSHDTEHQAATDILAELITERDDIKEQLAQLRKSTEVEGIDKKGVHRIKRLGLRALTPTNYALVGSAVAGIYHATH